MTTPVALTQAERALQRAGTPAEVLEVYDLAEAYRTYARNAEEQDRAVRIKLRAGAKGGHMLAADPDLGHGPGRGEKTTKLAVFFPDLEEVARQHLSSRWQRLAKIEAAGVLDNYEAGSDLSMAGCFSFAASGRRGVRVSLTKEERKLLDRCEAGTTIVANQHSHEGLITWAKDAGRYEPIDRSSPWGNPFIINADGDRAEVVDKYVRFYLPHKPSLLDRICDLRGQVLGCWCAPLACHGDILAEWADSCEC